MAVVRAPQWRYRLEFPAGKVLYETTGYVSCPRLSPKGDLIAFMDHPVFGDDRGSVAIIDLSGKKTTLSDGWESVHGLAWSPSGRGDLVHGKRPGKRPRSLRRDAGRKETHRARVSHGTGARGHLPRRAGSSAPGQRPGRVLRSDPRRGEGAGPLGSRVVELSASFRGRKAGRLQRRRRGRRPGVLGLFAQARRLRRRCGWARAPPSPSLPTGNGC